jgi:AraC-like DNA-binding protein
MRMGQRKVIGRVEQYFSDTRPIIALCETFPDSHHVQAHLHQRGQLFCPMSGLAMASTTHGTWLVPCRRALWIPAGVRHELRMEGVVAMQSLYFDAATFLDMPDRCRVVAISSLMRSLMAEAVALPIEYDCEGRSAAIMKLIGYEISRLRELPLSLPLPTDKGLARRCLKFSASPKAHANIDDWASSLHLTRRTFTRLFRRETGLSFVAWRQQACVLAALPKLSAGASVTQTAADLGYDNPAAFSTLFKRTLGVAPRQYIQSIDSSWEGSSRPSLEAEDGTPGG